MKSIGIDAPDEATASRLLKFGCPTQDAFGKWHRCTIVPVIELYNILSNISLIAGRLRTLTESLDSADVRNDLIRLEQLRTLLIRKDRRE